MYVPDRVPPMQRSSFLVSRKRRSMSTVYVFRSRVSQKSFSSSPPRPKKSKRAWCRFGAAAPKRHQAPDSSGVGGLLSIKVTFAKPCRLVLDVWRESLSPFAALRVWLDGRRDPLINGGAGAKSPAGARGVLARFSPMAGQRPARRIMSGSQASSLDRYKKGCYDFHNVLYTYSQQYCCVKGEACKKY